MSALSPQLDRIAKLLRSGLLRRSAIGTIDQALLSALNFAVTIILIKHVSKAEYGYFSIAFSLTLLVYSLECGLTLGPMWALLPGRSREDQHRIARGLFLGLIAIVAVAGILTFLFCSQVGALLHGDLSLWSAIRCLGLAAIGIAIREFHRSLFYCEEQPLKALRLDLTYAATYLVLVTAAAATSHLGAALVICAMGAAALATTMAFGEHGLWNADVAQAKAAYREAWQFSRWALLGVVITHIQQYGYLYMLGSMVDSTAAAEASASRLLLMPMGLILAGWGSMSIPHGHRLRLNNQLPRYFYQQLGIATGMSVMIAIYVLLLSAVSDGLFRLLFTSHYQFSGRLLALWGLSFIMDCFGTFAVLGLQVVKQFRIIALINAMTMLVASTAVFLLIRSHGVAGAILGLSIGQLALAISLWIVFWRHTVLHPEPAEARS